MEYAIIGNTRFVDGTTRTVFETLDGRQYVVDDDDDPWVGAWLLPEDIVDLPLPVPAVAVT